MLRAEKYTGADMKVLRADIPQQPMGIVAVANDTNSCKSLHQMRKFNVKLIFITVLCRKTTTAGLFHVNV